MGGREFPPLEVHSNYRFHREVRWGTDPLSRNAWACLPVEFQDWVDFDLRSHSANLGAVLVRRNARSTLARGKTNVEGGRNQVVVQFESRLSAFSSTLE